MDWEEHERREFRATVDENAGVGLAMVVLVPTYLIGWQWTIAAIGFMAGWMFIIRNINAHANASFKTVLIMSAFFFGIFVLFGYEKLQDDYNRMLLSALGGYIAAVPIGAVACAYRKWLWAQLKKLRPSHFLALVLVVNIASTLLTRFANLPPQPTYEQLARWHVRDHCGFPAHIDAWAICGARESDKFREQQIQLAVNAWPNI